ncbi:MULTISPECIES: hypothetical protein [unclassified Nocardioides]|uniref:hypothetical protein n=1 Tax=unclassified Nocardioides TaxID=2615069 RepID=UPI0000571026|nr:MULTISPECIES: hypothetical protein [unclassified Nocardioides]ABL79326.1 conserved hypothetical protein [Nocardioides sp. JS614]
MSRREPMAPIAGLKKPADLPAPSARPRTLQPVPEPSSDPAGEQSQDLAATASPAKETTRATAKAEQASKPIARTRKPRAEKATARSASADTMRPVSVSVPLTMAEAWRDRAKNDRTSQVDVLLDALVAHQNELTDLVSARSEKPTVSDGLFDRTPGAKGERFVGVSLRIKSGNLEVIDQLVDKHGADSRSQLVAAALSAYLA